MPEDAERLGFLSRWSRRKRGEEAAEPEPLPAPTLATQTPAEPTLSETTLAEPTLAEPTLAGSAPEAPPSPVAEAPPPEPEFDVSTLPPIETLDASSDYSVFLKPGVPQILRTAALRKAWLADPLIRDYMSPLDYAWDFNTPGGLPYGFSNVLAETGEALRKLVNQAIGEMEPEEEKTPEALPPNGVTLAEIPLAAAEEGQALAEGPPGLDDNEETLPPDPIRLTEPARPVQPKVPEEAPPVPRRRHGGATPA